jgi:Zn-dependent oligopeptidase
MLKLRNDIATIMGYKNYVAYSSEVKMAKTDSAVFSFIESLITKVKSVANLVIEKLHKEKQAYENNPRAKAEPYDIAFLSGRIKRTRYDSRCRKIFPS